MLPWAAGTTTSQSTRWTPPLRIAICDVQSRQSCLLRTSLPFRHLGHILRLPNWDRIETMVSLTSCWVWLHHHAELLSFVTDIPMHTHPLPNSKAGGSTPEMNLVWPGPFNCSLIECIDPISSFDILLFWLLSLAYRDRCLSLAYWCYQGFYP